MADVGQVGVWACRRAGGTGVRVDAEISGVWKLSS